MIYITMMVSIIVVCATIIIKQYVCKHVWTYSGKHKICSKCGVRRATPCEHKWETIETIDVAETSQYYARRVYIQKCSECGDIVKTKISTS